MFRGDDSTSGPDAPPADINLAGMGVHLERLKLRDAGDWRTLILVVALHALVWSLLLLPGSQTAGETLWVLAGIAALAPLMTMHSSLTHEVTHGHPFKAGLANDLLVMLPYSLLVSHYRFKDTHLAHHKDVNLCDPYEDPETWYQYSADWEKRTPVSRAIFNFNNTLLGRMLIGPLVGMFGFIRYEWGLFRKGETHIGWKWGLHLVLVAGWLTVIGIYSWMPLWAVLVAAYFGMALLMVRTYLEHQAHEKVRGRSVIIQDGGVFAFLFLNNSLHAVHHAYPGMAWYRLPRLFADNRERFLQLNDGYTFKSYRSVFANYLLVRKEPVPIEDALDKRR